MLGHADIYCWENLEKNPSNMGTSKESYTRKSDSNPGQSSNMVVVAEPIASDSEASDNDPENVTVNFVTNNVKRIALPTAKATIFFGQKY